MSGFFISRHEVRARSIAVQQMLRATALLLVVGIAACSFGDGSGKKRKTRTSEADSMGALPSAVRELRMEEPKDLVESSAAVITPAQPDIVFTINDSGNEPILFAMDTTGRFRGRWMVEGTRNRDWEAASHGPCTASLGAAPGGATLAANSASSCLFIGDVGDNAAIRPVVSVYQFREPMLSSEPVDTSVVVQQLTFRYADGPHDVESMYVGPDGTIYLLTKRALANAAGILRPSLVYAVPASAWRSGDTTVVSQIDSLPIIPGSSELRRLSDASLSQDSRFLAVRTYGQVYTFATDSLTGRVLSSIPPAVCNIESVEKKQGGEGVTWFGKTSQLLLTREDRNASMMVISCPLPPR